MYSIHAVANIDADQIVQANTCRYSHHGAY